MNRIELDKLISELYSVEGDHPWDNHPEYTVYRHQKSRKWFALVMNIDRKKLGLTGEGGIEVVNLKCDPRMTGSMRKEPGVYPAYHMNKANWLSVALDGSAADETVGLLLDMSFELTEPKLFGKRKARKKEETD